MKVYISGKISGLPIKQVKDKFHSAQDLLSNLDFEVINPVKNGLTINHSWEQHITRDVELLLSCDVIFMLDNWIDSVGAGIEYDIAVRTNKEILFESNFIKQQKTVLRIQNAIHEATGKMFSDCTTKSRRVDVFFPRMLFVHYCYQNNIEKKDIAQYVHRNISSVIYLQKKYDIEKKFNPRFQELAQKVEIILNKANILQ